MKDFGIADRARIRLAQLPTPLERLDRLSDALKADIWIKRDDLTGFAGGGNKVRKLEYLMAQALAQGADTVVTSGALQSNHARQTAAAAARLGLHPVLVLSDAVPNRTETYRRGGNLALDRLVGARSIALPPAMTARLPPSSRTWRPRGERSSSSRWVARTLPAPWDMSVPPAKSNSNAKVSV